MRCVVQRVTDAVLTVGGQEQARIGRGLVVLAGFAPSDGSDAVQWMADKVLGLRIFEDSAGKMNRSVVEVGGEVLAVPNFTLYGDCRKGRRPSFTGAAEPNLASTLFDRFCQALAGRVGTGRGVFGAHMHVTFTNDGPVTLLLDSEG